MRRTTEKRWGFLFTCLTTLAVHVENVPSMDASSRVVRTERDAPAIIWSDNGTNFVGAEKNYPRISKSGILSILQRNLPIKALSGGSTRPVRHTKVASGRGWYVVLANTLHHPRYSSPH